MAWGFWASKGFFQTCSVVFGSGETESAPDGKPPCNFARGLDGVGRDGKSRPAETFLRRLVSGGGRAPRPLEGTALTYLFRALLLRRGAWGLETAVPSRPGWMGRFACEINARVRWA